jgi:hypothetical protein
MIWLVFFFKFKIIYIILPFLVPVNVNYKYSFWKFFLLELAAYIWDLTILYFEKTFKLYFVLINIFYFFKFLFSPLFKFLFNYFFFILFLCILFFIINQSSLHILFIRIYHLMILRIQILILWRFLQVFERVPLSNFHFLIFHFIYKLNFINL